MCVVEWKPLKEIVESISTGLNPRQNFVLNEDYASLYYVTVKEISSNKIVFSENTDKISKEAKNIINKRSKLEIGDILVTDTTGYARKANDGDLMYMMLHSIPMPKVTSLNTGIDNMVATFIK